MMNQNDPLAILNALTQETKPADAGFSRLPVGDWPGVVTAITQKAVDNRPIWELKIETEKGVGTYTIWGYSALDIQQIQVDQNAREQMLRGIARIKRIFVDLGLQAPTSWSNGPDSILGMLPKLRGCKCLLVVRQNQKDPNKQVTFLNGLGSQMTGGSVPGFEAPPATTSVDRMSYDGTTAEMSVPGLDEIPF